LKVLLAWNGPANAAECGVLLRREIPLLRELVSKGVHPSVVLFDDRAGARRELEAAGLDVHAIAEPLPPSAAALGHLPSAVRRLLPLMRKLQPDLVEGNEPMPAIALGVAARASSRGAAVIYRRLHPRGGKRLRWASWTAARLSDRTLVLSEATRSDAMTDDGTRRELIDVAPSGSISPRPVSAEEIRAARRLAGISDGARVIGVVSRFRHEKGVDILLRALDSLRDLDGVHVILAGDGPAEAALRELAARAPLPVHFVGHRDDVEVWYSLAEVIVMPSRRESFGRVSTEVMASARPVVAARVGGLTETVVDGETGLLVPPEDPVALASALRVVLSDRGLAARMGASARARFEAGYTIAHMAAGRLAAWRNALGSAGVRTR
jgi:glycosyltransferase involved in cell wall biosynthesis